MPNRGFIYILVNAATPKLLKIGKTTRSPNERADELSQGSGVAGRFVVAFDIEVEDCDAAEAVIHQELSACRYSETREFFEMSLRDAMQVVLRTTSHLSTPQPGSPVSMTILTLACQAKDCDKVSQLLDARIDPNLTNADGTTPLMWAAAVNSVGIVRLLLARGADPKAQAPDGTTALDIAVMRGEKCEQTANLIREHTKPKFDLESINSPSSRLVLACQKNDIAEAKRVLEQRADPNCEFEPGESPLWLAIGHRNRDLVRLLIQHGAATESPDTQMHTLQIQSLLKRDATLAEFLLDCGVLTREEASLFLEGHGRLVDANSLLKRDG